MKTPRTFLSERDGNIGTLAAISLPLLIFSLALGVDYGYLTVQQRELQTAADLAAIAAASNVADAEKSAAGYFALNNLPVAVTGKDGATIPAVITTINSKATPATAIVERGRYTADPDIAPEERFKPASTDADAAA